MFLSNTHLAFYLQVLVYSLQPFISMFHLLALLLWHKCCCLLWQLISRLINSGLQISGSVSEDRWRPGEGQVNKVSLASLKDMYVTAEGPHAPAVPVVLWLAELPSTLTVRSTSSMHFSTSQSEILRCKLLLRTLTSIQLKTYTSLKKDI